MFRSASVALTKSNRSKKQYGFLQFTDSISYSMAIRGLWGLLAAPYHVRWVFMRTAFIHHARDGDRETVFFRLCTILLTMESLGLPYIVVSPPPSHFCSFPMPFLRPETPPPTPKRVNLSDSNNYCQVYHYLSVAKAYSATASKILTNVVSLLHLVPQCWLVARGNHRETHLDVLDTSETLD